MGRRNLLSCGILPLHIETRRYRGVIEDEKICEYCELYEVGNEINFILYHDLRQMFRKVHVLDILDRY